MVLNKLPGLRNGARVILAPLCGITTAPFRRICLEQGADMVVTEMVSSEAVTRGKSEDCKATRGLDIKEGPLSLQIFGGDPEKMWWSLNRKLAALDDDTVLYPGHNYADRPASTLGDEKRTNPYLQYKSVSQFLRDMRGF